ncbi:MAG: type I secretion C-terminal target domain-containing protein, partial [Pseudomonadota bacterium]
EGGEGRQRRYRFKWDSKQHRRVGFGDDILWGNSGNDIIFGSNGNDIIDGGPGADNLRGDLDNDIITGGEGDDIINGGDGDDILYGGWDLGLAALDKDFVDNILMPELQSGVDVRDLVSEGDVNFGLKSDSLNVDFDATATLTFREGFAGYNNSLGVYNIAEDGTIGSASILWGNVKDAGIDISHQIDLPVSENGGTYGFFIISNGDRVNDGYDGLDISDPDNIQFIYDYGGAGERPATVYDDGNSVSVVYNDGVTELALNGPHYHTTTTDGSVSINSDGEVHTISGSILDGNEEVLRIGFEDLTNLGDADFEDVLFDLDVNEVFEDQSEIGNDTLIGGGGNDQLYGEAGDDILVVGEGSDIIDGGSGSDQIVYDFLDAAQDTIVGFEVGAGGDVLNVTDILQGYDPVDGAIADFLQLSQNGENTDILVNADGAGDDWVNIATFEGGISEGVEDLLANGNLVADQSVVV